MNRRRRPPACESLALPHAYGYARLYVNGWRCPRHTPAAEAGRPEVPPGPGWPIHRTPATPPWPPVAAPGGARTEPPVTTPMDDL